MLFFFISSVFTRSTLIRLQHNGSYVGFDPIKEGFVLSTKYEAPSWDIVPVSQIPSRYSIMFEGKAWDMENNSTMILKRPSNTPTQEFEIVDNLGNGFNIKYMDSCIEYTGIPSAPLGKAICDGNPNQVFELEGWLPPARSLGLSYSSSRSGGGMISSSRSYSSSRSSIGSKSSFS
ncbi:hypothetical protein TCON_0569 [Astathelohania contejeani]|uniref:Uncharacterized protein n=1 Tax=Astathelohania contejeani TaxID=164912 RepID=A0ABQ7I1H9_9MICR|nr:hypothetical protein TCON_0569 [Thelohania contejeani]